MGKTKLAYYLSIAIACVRSMECIIFKFYASVNMRAGATNLHRENKVLEYSNMPIYEGSEVESYTNVRAHTNKLVCKSSYIYVPEVRVRIYELIRTSLYTVHDARTHTSHLRHVPARMYELVHDIRACMSCHILGVRVCTRCTRRDVRACTLCTSSYLRTLTCDLVHTLMYDSTSAPSYPSAHRVAMILYAILKFFYISTTMKYREV